MRAILYVSHGSRVKDGIAEARQFIETCMKQIPVSIQEICFLELVQPTIQQGVERCMVQGATEIVIQPVLLFAAGHVKKDIPDEVNRVRQLYPEVMFSYSKPFGYDERIIELLRERLYKRGTPVLGEAMILLVGRGSSDPETKANFEQISEALWNKEGLPIHTCFLAACSPRFSDGLKYAQKSGFSQVFVLPYLMFSGILIQDMKQGVNPLLHTDDQTLYLCQPLGNHERLREVLIDRVLEALRQKEEAMT